MAGDRIDVSVVSSGHDVADARLHRIISALRRQGLSVELFGLGDAEFAPVGVRAHTRLRRTVVGRGVDAVSAPWRARGRVLLVVDPDLVPVGLLRQWSGRQLVVDVHEDYSRLAADRTWSSGTFGPLVRRGIAAINEWSTRADLVVVADDHLPPMHARERMVVHNLPDYSHLPTPSARDTTPRAVYIGDVRASRGLFAMLDLAVAAPEWEIDIVGPVASIDHDEAGRRLGPLDGRVRMHGRMPPEAAWQLARGAWLGLSMLEPTPAFLQAMPSKVYEYLACGLPVLATDLPRQAELLSTTGAGVVVSDVDQAGVEMREWALEPTSLDPMRSAALSWSEQTRLQSSEYDALAARIAVMVNQ